MHALLNMVRSVVDFEILHDSRFHTWNILRLYTVC